MRSFTAPSGNTYSHNGDFSGSILVNREDLAIDGHDRVAIPADDVIALAAEYLRRRAVTRIEEMSVEEIMHHAING